LVLCIATSGAGLAESAALPAANDAAKPAPPGQPATGPGGREYAHLEVKQMEHGESGQQFWIIEPTKPSTAPAPLVIFLHGYSAMEPGTYRGWLNHLAKRGSIVVYPRYQERLLTPATEYFPNIIASLRQALAVLAGPGHSKPDLERVVVVGHSAGAVEAANYCVNAALEKLPIPKAAMLVQPGQGPKRGLKLVPLDDCTRIPTGIRLLVVVGDADGVVGDSCARLIWRDARHVRDRSFVTVQSDHHGVPPLRANHLSPVSWTPQATDALDWLGYWKMLDGLMDAAFAGREYVVDPSLGAWSDGTPVKPLKVER
jgi:poly(3-hydroxybutyrate) depolymerase